MLCFNHDRVVNHVFNVNYLNGTYQLHGLEQVKINGVLFRQDPVLREICNVEKVTNAMEKHLADWSTRHLTLLGKILIIKTFAISQVIYLLQSMSINEVHYKAITKVIYKYLWNRNFNGARAPERLKRTIMLTPVRLGGFGMIDVKDLGDSLDLRSYGRLLRSDHPFFVQVKELIDFGNFFSIESRYSIDRKFKSSLVQLNRARSKILAWPSDEISASTSLATILLDTQLCKLLTRQGRLSLPYFIINSRVPNARIRQISLNEFNNVIRFLAHPQLGTVIRSLLTMPNLAAGSIAGNEAYPLNNKQIVNVSTLTSKIFRQDLTIDEDKIICLYKIGIALTPGEVIAWTSRLKRLTSTRHRNILLRAVHGDIFSNSRLHKFGLRASSNCANCQETIETIQHRINGCQKALEAWSKLNEAKMQIGLNTLSDFSLENLIGAKDLLTKVELALNAELILKLTTKSDGYSPSQLARATVQLIGASEPIKDELKGKIREYLERNQN